MLQGNCTDILRQRIGLYPLTRASEHEHVSTDESPTDRAENKEEQGTDGAGTR